MMLKSLEAIEKEYLDRENEIRYANVFSDIFGEVIDFIERHPEKEFSENETSIISHDVLTTFEHKLMEYMSVVPMDTIQHSVKYYMGRAQGSIPKTVEPILDQILRDATAF